MNEQEAFASKEEKKHVKKEKREERRKEKRKAGKLKNRGPKWNK